MPPRLACLVPVVAVVLWAGPGAPVDAAPPEPWRAGLSASVQQGDYGTATETTAVYLWATVRRLFDEGDVRVLLPFVSVTHEDARGTATTASGPGDVRLGGRWYAYESPDFDTLLGVTGEVKLPTADEDEGLGTGEADIAVGLEWTRFVTPDVFVFADPAYTFVGDPPGVDLNDQWRLAVGGGGYPAGNVAVSAAYERRRALTDGEPDPEEALLAISRGGKLTLQAALNVGLSDSAPDYGVTAGATVRF